MAPSIPPMGVEMLPVAEDAVAVESGGEKRVGEKAAADAAAVVKR